MSFMFSRNSEAMFLRYYIHVDVFIKLRFPITHQCVTRRKDSASPACLYLLHVCISCMFVSPACLYLLHVCISCMFVSLCNTFLVDRNIYFPWKVISLLNEPLHINSCRLISISPLNTNMLLMQKENVKITNSHGFRIRSRRSRNSMQLNI